jgi:hypothetical protein
VGVSIDQAGNNDPAPGIDNLRCRADGIRGVLAHIGNPLAFDGNCIIIQYFGGIDIDDPGVDNGQVGLFLTQCHLHQLASFFGSFGLQNSSTCHFRVIPFLKLNPLHALKSKMNGFDFY